MDHAISALIIILFVICIITSCLPIPLSPGVYRTANKIEDLVDKNASRDDVIAILGNPMMQHESHISYLTCGKGGGVDLHHVWAQGLIDPKRYRGKTACFELVLEFDEHNQLIAYKLTKLTGEEREKLLLSMAEQGAQYQLYYSSHTRSERLMWLCRAAESGFPLAQAEVGRLYRWGLNGVEQNYKKAYQWYWLANKQVPESWVDELNDAKQMATSSDLQPLSENEMNGLQPVQYECELLQGSAGN